MNISSNQGFSVAYFKKASHRQNFAARIDTPQQLEELQIKRTALRRVRRAFNESAEKGYVTPKDVIRANLLQIWQSPLETVKAMLRSFPDNHK